MTAVDGTYTYTRDEVGEETGDEQDLCPECAQPTLHIAAGERCPACRQWVTVYEKPTGASFRGLWVWH